MYAKTRNLHDPYRQARDYRQGIEQGICMGRIQVHEEHRKLYARGFLDAAFFSVAVAGLIVFIRALN
jgi:hypothetical protein